jgi:hypothetical protein
MNTTQAKPKPCQCLRTKNPYGTMPQDAESWLHGVDASSSYWCLNTMSFAGPDDHYVHLSRCVPGRKCYEAPEE